jgi:hypothetical protein
VDKADNRRLIVTVLFCMANNTFVLRHMYGRMENNSVFAMHAGV